MQGDDQTDREDSGERDMVHAVVLGIGFMLPLAIVGLWIGLWVLTGRDIGDALATSLVPGVLIGVFFGGFFGVARTMD